MLSIETKMNTDYIVVFRIKFLRPNSDLSNNTGCGACLKEHYNPVCANGNTYLSPCVAGCQTANGPPFGPKVKCYNVFHLVSSHRNNSTPHSYSLYFSFLVGILNYIVNVHKYKLWQKLFISVIWINSDFLQFTNTFFFISVQRFSVIARMPHQASSYRENAIKIARTFSCL